MLSKAAAPKPSLELKKLMASAMAEKQVEAEYARYIEDPNRNLYLMGEAAFIGIDLKGASRCEIRHIAVGVDCRSSGIGSWMIKEVIKLHNIQEIAAETDVDAVDFYRKIGFNIKSLGEKYPGRERFYCVKTLPSK
ncbi:GNAT family N-acetyltransferase [Planomicrobium sp. MB-3u-38]|uniref:GNAT family N-acetyltransferase n=1 Tax=Planomicrobium sp. MB-3u-38 TaxID=2058318 RepID=UPI000C79ADF7|nr:GNAT family N-acetyltransferase [Planomicrobium sp. MB-3u-38]PKH12028.1 GNAT family N-acetyltransferase [Planomicrobium sp. MB-3u-38]